MQQTLTVAHDLFAQRGYAAATMDEVAAAVGVTKPLLYNYFGNKERLYIACMEPVGDELLTMIGQAVAGADGPAEALEQGMRAFFDFIDSDRSAWAVLFNETSPHVGTVADTVADYRGRIAMLVAASLLARLPDHSRAAAQTEVEALSAALLGAAEELARWWLRTEALSARETANLLISAFEPGLRILSVRGSYQAAGNGHSAAGNGRTSAGNGRSPAGKGRASAGNGRSTAGKGRASAGNGRSTAGKGRASAGNGRASAGNGRSTAGRARPKGKGRQR